METLHLRCAGIDVHQDACVVCVRLQDAPGTPPTWIPQRFGTMHDELVRMRDWLRAHQVTHVLMEATGVYWFPVHAVLDEHFDLTVGNAHHLRNVPGRKTDALDARWLAQLLAAGLVRKSFVPDADTQQLREWTRLRTELAHDHARRLNQLTRLLESHGIKLASVASTMNGVGIRAMVGALASGERDPVKIANLAMGRMRLKTPELMRAVSVPLSSSTRNALKSHLRLLTAVEAEQARADKEIARHVRRQSEALARLCTIPGVSASVASVILSETGGTLSTFASSAHLASWCGLCPGQRESAGKSQGGQIRRGNQHLKSSLVQAAWAAVRSKGTQWPARYARLCRTKGPAKAIIAVAHALLRVIFHVLKNGVPYRETLSAPIDEKARAKALRYHAKKLQQLGLDPLKIKQLIGEARANQGS